MGSSPDDVFNDYMQHLSSFGSGDQAYTSPQATTVALSTRQGGVLGNCKSSIAAQNNLHAGYGCDYLSNNCNIIGS